MIFLDYEAVNLDSTMDNLWITAAQAALAAKPEHQNDDIAIAFVSDEDIQALNHSYRGIDAPTDVLSFLSEEVDPETGRLYLGDIIISLPRAKAQSQKAGHPIENELRLLIVHGVLHLLGYDHANPEEKTIMWQSQETILASIGCVVQSLPEGD